MVVLVEGHVSSHLSNRHLGCILESVGSKFRPTATRLLVIPRTLVFDVAVPLVLVGADEPEMALIETDSRVDRRLEFSNRSVHTNKDVPS